MRNREQIYGQEAAELLRSITVYHCMRRDQLLRLYRDEYFENHFVISLEKLSLMLPPDFIENPKSYN